MKISPWIISVICASLIIITGCDYGTGVINSASEFDPDGLFCNSLKLGPKDGSKAGLVNVHKLDDGYCYPVGIFSNVSKPDECKYDHYHYDLLSLDGSKIRKDEGDCGAATSENLKSTGYVFVDESITESWNKQWSEIISTSKKPTDVILDVAE